MKINCIAIDDEPLALDIIRVYCSKIPFLNLIRTFDNALDTLEFLASHPVDLIFLDIQMEGLTGIQLLKALKNRPQVIITSAFDRYAAEGFDLDVTDYLLKPISLERFIRGVNKVFERWQQAEGAIAHSQTAPSPAPHPASDLPSPAGLHSASDLPTTAGLHSASELQPSPDQHTPSDPYFPSAPVAPQTVTAPSQEQEYFFVKTETRMEKLLASEILYVQGMGDYWRIVTSRKKIKTLMNARAIGEILREPRFCRVHKSWFVALDKIDFVERRHIKIGNEHIPVSESYQKRFFELIEKNKLR